MTCSWCDADATVRVHHWVLCVKHYISHITAHHCA